MKGIKIALLCIAAMMIFVGTASAQFPQHWAKETTLPLWVWNLSWGLQVIPIQMVFPNIIANPELPPIATYYGVVSGNRVRWYFDGAIKKPISDLLLCVRGLVFKEQFPQTDGYLAQTGRSADSPAIPLFLQDQPRIAAWALPAGFMYAQRFAPSPMGGLPAMGMWNPFYLSARLLPGVAAPPVVLDREPPPGIPGGPGTHAITLINGFQICLLIKLPVMNFPTGADIDGDADNPLFALILNDTGTEAEVALASGDRIAVQIDIPSGHLHNIYLSPVESVVVKYLTPNP